MLDGLDPGPQSSPSTPIRSLVWDVAKLQWMACMKAPACTKGRSYAQSQTAASLMAATLTSRLRRFVEESR
jgi:hypothetical protein